MFHFCTKTVYLSRSNNVIDNLLKICFIKITAMMGKLQLAFSTLFASDSGETGRVREREGGWHAAKGLGWI